MEKQAQVKERLAMRAAQFIIMKLSLDGEETTIGRIPKYLNHLSNCTFDKFIYDSYGIK